MDNKKRSYIQAISTLLQNANFKGFFTGKIYTGKIKSVCVPGLNCYSCPGAVGSCPVGSFQNFLSSQTFKFPYYVMGLLIFFGALLGRTICGFLCPFGFLQDIIYKIPFKKKIRTFKYDRILRIVKYFILIFFVIIMPISVKLTPFFCKYICPSGTVAGILLALGDNRIIGLFGTQFMWKFCMLSCIILAGIVLIRPFCKYICPLGAFYGFFNKFALIKINIDFSKCTGCHACENNCDMAINPVKEINSSECIRCGKCISSCPADALNWSFINKTK